MTAIWIFPGSKGSSTGSSKIENCYPDNPFIHMGFRHLGSSCSSSPYFSAEFENEEEKGVEMEKYIYGVKTSATFATQTPRSLMYKGFKRVAVLKTTATPTATSATQITLPHNI